MKTITSNTEAEIVEKRSKFIGNLYYVETEEQAENKLDIIVLHIEFMIKIQL